MRQGRLRHGRPIAFVLLVIGGWITLRIVLLLPVPSDATPIAPPAFPAGTRPRFTPPVRHLVSTAPDASLTRMRRPYRLPALPRRPAPGAESVARSTDPHPIGRIVPVSSAMAGGVPDPLPASAAPAPARFGRWSGSGWMLWWHDDAGAGLARGGRLGGSQAGGRIDYALAPDSVLRPALYGRISTALSGVAAAEGAFGIALRPRLPLPLTLAIERRQAITRGGRRDFALVLAGGIPPIPIGGDLRIDGYGQAGVVGTARRDAFADGRLTIEHGRGRRGDFAIGLGLWGGAQPGTTRLDIGPHISTRFPIETGAVRIGIEWRQRIAGDAAPASGPALSIGSDF